MNEPVFELEPYQRAQDFVMSPFRYPGGKYYALKHLLPYINCVPHSEFREPFVGGGSVFFGKKKVDNNWINDLEADLITTYKFIADPSRREELIELVTNEIATKKRHEELKEYEPSNQMEVAYKTFYLNRTSFSGIINAPAWGYREGKSSPPKNWGRMINRAGPKLEGVKITALDFPELIPTSGECDHILLYLDPPYFHADQRRAYTKPFEDKDHIRLAELLKKTTARFCLSYDDSREIRDLYSWAQIHTASWQYNTANCNGDQRMMGEELIITNYRVSKQTQMSLL